MEDRLRLGKIHTHNLTDNELVNDHLKHLVRNYLNFFFFQLNSGIGNLIIFCFFQVGSRTSIENEVLYRFLLPEKSGSLLNFLDAFTPRWNITMFNYRGRVTNYLHFSSWLICSRGWRLIETALYILIGRSCCTRVGWIPS